MVSPTKAEFDVLAHDKASDKLDRISRAFRKLSQESDNVKKNDGLTKLSGDLKKVADDFEKEGTRAGKGFGSSLKKWFAGDGSKLLGQGGQIGGDAFKSGLSGVLKTPVLGPIVAGALAAAVATAAPAAGAIAGAGLVAGFGAGLAGLGLVFAAKSDAVQNKWKSTMTQLGADMRLLSKPFESTLISIAGYFQRTADRFNPVLAQAFQKMAPMVDKFVDGAARSLEQLVPAIGPITDAFGEVLDALGPALQSAVGSLSRGMTGLALSVEKNPEGLADMVKGLGEFTGLALNLVRILNDVNGSFTTLTGGTSLVEVVMEGLKGVMAPLITLFAGFGKVLDLTNAALGKTGKDSANAGAAMSKAANDTILLAQGAGAAAGQFGKLSPAVETATTKLDRQTAATQRSIDALNRQSDLLLSLSGAEIGYQQAVDDATAAIKENGKTHDLNTQKGRDNQRALDAVAASAKAQRDAMLKANDGNVKAAKAAETGRAAFIKLAQQMGYSKAEAIAMAQSLIKIPNVSREARLTANKKDLETKLAAAKRELDDPKGVTKARKAQLLANIAKLQAGIAAAKAALASVPPSKTVTIRTRFITERIVRGQTTSGGGHAPGEPDARAAGGPVKKGHPYIVGEEGPEWMIPDQNGTILPNGAKSARGMAAAGASAGSQVTVKLEVGSAGGRMEQLFVQMIREFVRVNGGDVQAVLGR